MSTATTDKNETIELKELIKKNNQTMNKQANKLREKDNRIKKLTDIIHYNGLRISDSKVRNHVTDFGYIRIAMYLNPQRLLEEIVACKDENYKLSNGEQIVSQSLRYQTFVHNLKCVSCGVEGVFLALEKKVNDYKAEKYHLNLYAIDDLGKEVLMTKDHKIPKSKGGTDDLNNLQTMCTYCNSKKGTDIWEDENSEVQNEEQ